MIGLFCFSWRYNNFRNRKLPSSFICICVSKVCRDDSNSNHNDSQPVYSIIQSHRSWKKLKKGMLENRLGNINKRICFFTNIIFWFNNVWRLSFWKGRCWICWLHTYFLRRCQEGRLLHAQGISLQGYLILYCQARKAWIRQSHHCWNWHLYQQKVWGYCTNWSYCFNS